MFFHIIWYWYLSEHSFQAINGEGDTFHMFVKSLNPFYFFMDSAFYVISSKMRSNEKNS